MIFGALQIKAQFNLMTEAQRNYINVISEYWPVTCKLVLRKPKLNENRCYLIPTT